MLTFLVIMRKDENVVELPDVRYLEIIMQFQFAERAWIVRAVTLQIAWVLIKGPSSCKLRDFWTSMKAGVQDAAWRLVEPGVLPPGPPPHPHMAALGTTDGNGPCLPRIGPFPVLLALHFNSRAMLCTWPPEIHCQIAWHLPSTFSLTVHTAAQYWHRLPCQWLGGTWSFRPGSSPLCSKELGNWPVGFGHAKPHLAAPELKGSITPGTCWLIDIYIYI